MSVYEITVKGRVGEAQLWALEGFEVVPGRRGETRFRGEVANQQALHEVLDRVARCNLSLTSVDCVRRTSED